VRKSLAFTNYMKPELRQTGELEDWERDIGSSREHGAPASLDDSSKLSKAIDEASGLHLVSVRLQKSLIEDLKAMAKDDGIGYQPLLRQILTRAVAAYKEKKMVAK
jgi:hypothetical protein